MPRYRCLGCRYSLEGHKDQGPIIRCPECGFENDLESQAIDLDGDAADPPGFSAAIRLCFYIMVIIWGCVAAWWSVVGLFVAGLGLLMGIVQWVRVSCAVSDLPDNRLARSHVLRFVIYTTGVCVYASVALWATAWLVDVAGRSYSSGLYQDLYRLALFPVAIAPFVVFAWACRTLLVRWLKAYGAMFEALDRTEPRP